MQGGAALSKTFFPDFDEYMADKEGQSETAYAEKLLKKLLGTFMDAKEVRAALRASDGAAFEWFNVEHSCPVKLYSKKKIAVKLSTLLSSKGFTRSEVWKTYFEFKSEYPREAEVGLIFPIPRCGQFIMHNCFRMPLISGYNTIVRQATSSDKGIIISPFDAFLVAVRQIWQPS